MTKNVSTIDEKVSAINTINHGGIVMTTDEYERMRNQDFENFTKIALTATAAGYLLTNEKVQEKAVEGVCKIIDTIAESSVVEKIANMF
jgi:hypothetical protein